MIGATAPPRRRRERVPMKRTRAAAPAVVAVLAVLSACSSGGGGSVSAFCKQAKDLVAQNKAAQASGADASKKAVAGLKALSAKSPSEIKTSARVVSATLDQVVAAKNDQKKLDALFNDKKFTEAEQKLSAYAKDKCNVDFNA
jgi:hypothetical protein